MPMRALRFARYGGPEELRIEEVPEGEVPLGHAMVRVHAVSLNPLDWKLRAGHLRLLPMFRGPPRGLGCDFAGEIVAIGGGATERHVGERVFGSIMPYGRDGALADMLVAPYARMLPIPQDLDVVAAAALPIAAGTALQALTDEACVTPGQRVLVTGAAGGVGHFAVQIGKHLGAYVVGVCSAGNATFVRERGADEVIDYTAEDFTARSEPFDVVLDAAGVSSFARSRRILASSGCYINTGGDAASVVATLRSALMARLTSRQRAVLMVVKSGQPLWRRLLACVRAGALVPQVARIIGLEDVAEAQRAMATGHGRGKIVVRLV
ncbi:MAG: NAD(P)-dependent alcohol dehydrogenase [Casimicrobiaceae bacterium]